MLGNKLHVDTNDPRWNTKELKGNQKGKKIYNDKNKNYMLSPDDPKIQLLNLSLGLIGKDVLKRKNRRWYHTQSGKTYFLEPKDPIIAILNLKTGRGPMIPPSPTLVDLS